MRTSRRGFTLIELLVVVAIIALLISILLPSLSSAQEQGKRVKCLANMSSIGKAMWQYAGEDSVESAVPIFINHVRSVEYWLWRHANWHAWGGRSGDLTYWTAEGNGLWLDEPEENEQVPLDVVTVYPEYDVKRRPLTIYMTGGDIGVGDEKKLEYFGCPSDIGYPQDALIDDAPPFNATRSLYRTVGNSYRGSFIMYGQRTAPAAGASNGHFTLGPWGTRISTLIDTSRLVWYGEPTWFNMIGNDSTPGIADEVDVFGWHKRKLVDNLMFVDGSARSTVAEKEQEWAPETLAAMNVFTTPARFSNVRLDTYPVGGARIWGNWSSLIGQAAGRWPFGAYQDNLNAK